MDNIIHEVTAVSGSGFFVFFVFSFTKFMALRRSGFVLFFLCSISESFSHVNSASAKISSELQSVSVRSG